MICRLAIACLILLTSQPTLSGEGVTHWALRPVEKPPLPEVDNKAWIKNPVDLFVLARLEEADLEPSPPASAGGGVKGGTRHGATDEYGFYAERGKVHIHDFHATLLYLLGIDHEKLTYRHGGRDFRLTDVFGNVVHDILS